MASSPVSRAVATVFGGLVASSAVLIGASGDFRGGLAGLMVFWAFAMVLFETSHLRTDQHFQTAIERNVQLSLAEGKSLAGAWETIPYRLAFFDYLGNNPAKGGLFRNGPMNNGDGIALGWSGHAAFTAGDGSSLFVRRMPTFFETFPVLLLDKNGTVRADIPFRRAESKYSIEQVEVSTAIYGGVLSGSVFTNRRSVTQFARRAQLGELVDFDRETNRSDGVFRSSPRGWFAFAHIFLGLVFLFGHWWHGARTLFRDVFSGIDSNSSEQVEFGSFLKVGDASTSS